MGSLPPWSRRYVSLKCERSSTPLAVCNLHDLLFLSIPQSSFCCMMTFATWPTTPAVRSAISSATPGERCSFEYHFLPVGPRLHLEVCLVILPKKKKKKKKRSELGENYFLFEYFQHTDKSGIQFREMTLKKPRVHCMCIWWLHDISNITEKCLKGKKWS